ELDSEKERLQLEEDKSRLATTRSRSEALRRQITAEDQAWPEEKKSATLAIEEARARQHEAEAAAIFSEGEAVRMKLLEKNGVLSKSELLRAESEGQKQRAAAMAQTATVARLESEVKSKERIHEVRLTQLQRDAALIEGDIGTTEATIKRNEFVVEQRRIR